MKFYKPSSPLKMLKLRLLYREAFPKCERKPFSIIKAMSKKGKTDLWYFEDEGRFAGLCATINGPDTILIDYLAVSKKRRGTGVGTRMLKSLLEHYKDYGVFLEIEKLNPDARNNNERIRRREFYLRCGLEPMGTYVKLFGVDMELLGKSCRLSFDEYRGFYLCNYGKFAYDNIKPIDEQ
jgi:GNAT superfamily N-acetyltransferase